MSNLNENKFCKKALKWLSIKDLPCHSSAKSELGMLTDIKPCLPPVNFVNGMKCLL